MGWPSNSILPDITGMAPLTTLAKVLLPAPLAPRMATASATPTSREMSCSTSTDP